MKFKMVLMAVILSLAIQSCYQQVDCPDHPTTTYVDLASDELDNVTYTGTDTICFSSNSGDTSVIVGQGKQYYYDKDYNTYNPNCLSITMYQGYKIEYKPLKGELQFTFRQERRNWSLRITDSNLGTNFMLSGYRIIGSTSQYRFIPEDSYGTGADTTNVCYYNRSRGILYIKSSKNNKEYMLINR